jgi:hypothetical protein
MFSARRRLRVAGDELVLPPLTEEELYGRGKRLFAEGTKPVALKAIDRRSTDAGVSIDVYVPASEPTFGAIGPEIEARSQPTRRPTQYSVD